MSILEQLEANILPASKLQDDGVPSASLALLEGGTVSTHVIGPGQENAETVYQCGSVSKAITALGVARMVDLDLLTYDSKIVDFLPQDLPIQFIEPQTIHLLDLVTVRMLITHTSGLTQPYGPGQPNDVEDLPSVEQSVRGDPTTGSVRMRFSSLPGAQLLYCSGSFTLLQIAMETVSGKSFCELMQSLVIEPLGMFRTFYGDLHEHENNYAKPHLTGYHQTPTGVHRFTELAAVGLWSTPTDLLKAIQATQQSLRSDNGFLRQLTARELLINGAVSFRSGPARHRCGLGWYSTFQTFAHRGANPGYHSYVFGFFDQAPAELHRSGFAVMTNSLLGLETIRPLVSAIFYLKNWPRQKLMPSSLGLDDYAPYAAPVGTTVDPSWKQWKGTWGDEWSLSEANDQPLLQLRTSQTVKLLPAAAPSQHFEDNSKREMVLVAEGLSGTAVRLTWDGEGKVLELLQLAKSVLRQNKE